MQRTKKTVGVIMLETRFPRLLGDIGNPDSFDFPVIYETVTGASPVRVVEQQDHDLLIPYIQAGQRLIKRGAEIVTTSCGFLAMFQNELQDALPVPVFTSALLMLEELEAKFGKNQVGILTIRKASMTADFCQKTGIGNSIPIASPEMGIEFTPAILQNRTELDAEQCEKDLLQAAFELVEAAPQTKAILLECTNMPPYANSIESKIGLPVFSLNTLLKKAQNSG